MFRTRLISAVALTAFLAAVIGFPVPDRPQKADEDFACRDHACGCLNAEMCRTQCCCFKPTPVKSCCTAAADSCEEAPPVEMSPREKRESVGLVIQALACKGLTSHWVGLSLPVEHGTRLAVPGIIPTTTIIRVSDALTSPIHSLLPDVPPPRA